MLKVRILTPKGKVYESEAELVNFRTVEGAMGVLHRRAPIITHLKIHDVEIVKGGRRDRMSVAGGFLSCDGEEVVVLTTDAGVEKV